MMAVTVNEAAMEAQTTKELELESSGVLERSVEEPIGWCMVEKLDVFFWAVLIFFFMACVIIMVYENQ